jgi:cytoskeletal protein RodZ
MMDDDQLGSRLRGQLDLELGDLRAQPGSRERLRRGMRKRRRSPWFRSSILVPVATALAIAGLVLAIPTLLNRDDDRQVVPAGPAPVSTSVDPVPSLPPTTAPPKTPTPKRTSTAERPRPTTQRTSPARTTDPAARPTAEVTSTHTSPAKNSAPSATATKASTAETTPTPSAASK